MKRMKPIMALAIASVAALAIAALSRAPASPLESSQPLVRLSWRVLGVRVEECRPRTEEELAALAAHMRTPQVCTGGVADYVLRVSIDGAETVRDTVRPSGARRDRPTYVFRDLPVEQGRHQVQVAFSALVPTAFEVGEQPLEFSWEGDVFVDIGEIALITLNPSGDALVHRAP